MSIPSTGAARGGAIDASPDADSKAGRLRASGAAWFVGLCLVVAAASALVSGPMQALVPTSGPAEAS